MTEYRAPAIVSLGERAEVRCTTPGCRKLIGELSPATRLLAGWIQFHCARCKADYRIYPDRREPDRVTRLAS